MDPLSFGRMYHDARKRRLWIFREIYEIGLSNRRFAEKLTPDEKRTLTIADSAEPKSIAELSGDYDLNIYKCMKGAGSVEQGLKWLADLEEIIIDPVACPGAAFEFVNYALDVNKLGITISKYPDKDNHAIDMTRYTLQEEIRSSRVRKRKPVSARSLGL